MPSLPRPLRLATLALAALSLSLPQPAAATAAAGAELQPTVAAEAPDSAQTASPDALGSVSDPRTLSQLLQWSLQHTDLDALHQKAEAIRARQPGVGLTAGVLSADGNVGDIAHIDLDGGGEAERLPSPADVSTSHLPMREGLTRMSKEDLKLLSDLLMPDQVELMKSALELALNTSAAMEEREEGLLALQELVEDIDHARDFMTIGGFTEVLRLLQHEEAPLQAAAAWVIGTGVQNQRELQLQMLELGAMPPLLQLVQTHAVAAVRAKALYALSGMLRNCREAQHAFEVEGGIGTLVHTLADRSNLNLMRKALVVLTDLLSESTERAKAHHPDSELERRLLRTSLRNSTQLCAAVLAGLSLDDIDTQEKAVEALLSLVEAGMLPGGPTGSQEGDTDAVGADGSSASCTLVSVQSALRAFANECAETSACGDAAAIARRLEQQLTSGE